MPRGDLAKIPRARFEAVWTREDISTDRIAEALGVTRQAVSFHARRLGLPPRTKVRRRKIGNELFRRMWLAGMSTSDIAREFGYASRSALSRRRVILGLPPRTRGGGTSKHGGWEQTISLSQFYEQELGRAWAAEARRG